MQWILFYKCKSFLGTNIYASAIGACAQQQGAAKGRESFFIVLFSDESFCDHFFSDESFQNRPFILSKRVGCFVQWKRSFRFRFVL